MASVSTLDAQQRFDKLRNDLDQLGYMQPLTLDSLQLVESIFTDLVWTTKNYRQCKAELDKLVKVCENVEERVDLHKSNKSTKDMQSQIKQLKEQQSKLLIFNQQCLDKIDNYEADAKRMTLKLVEMREKAFRNATDSNEEVRPAPQNCSNFDEFCHDLLSAERVDSCSSNQDDIINSISYKCKELSCQLLQADRELEISDKKIMNYCTKLKLYEEKICRLTMELENRRCMDSVSISGHQRSNSKLVDRLNAEIRCLQQKNDALECVVSRLNVDKCKERNMDENDDCKAELENFRLRKQINELLDQKEIYLQELSALHCKSERRTSDCIPFIEESLDKEVLSLQRYIKTLEADRTYWRREAEKDNFNRTSGSNTEDVFQMRDALKHCQCEIKELECRNKELCQMLNIAERNSSPSFKDKDRSRDLESEVRNSRVDRDSMQNVVEKFERQLHDVQGNVSVLSHERDMLVEKLEDSQKEVHELREMIIQSDKSKRNSQSNQASLMLRKLEAAKNESLSDLHQMTTERDSLRERLRAVTETGLSDKARLQQKLEDSENQRQQLAERTEEMIEKMLVLRNKLDEAEEYNQQLKKRNDSLEDSLDIEKMKLQDLAVDLQKFESKVKMKVKKESQMSEELKEKDSKLMSLQHRSDSQNLEISDLRNDSIRLNDMINNADYNKEQLQNELDTKNEQLKMKEKALDEVRVNMTALEQQLKRIRTINTQRDKDLSAIVLSKKQIEHDLKTELCKCDELRAENCKLENTLLSLTRDHQMLESDIQEVKRRVMDCADERNGLEQQLCEYRAINSEVIIKNNELIDRCRDISLENDKLQLSMQRLETINEELMAEMDSRMKSARNTREQLDQTEQQMAELMNNVRCYEDQVSCLQLGGSSQLEDNRQTLIELERMRDFCCKIENDKRDIEYQLSMKLSELSQVNTDNNNLSHSNAMLRAQIDSLQETIVNLEAAMTTGQGNDFNSRLELQERICDLERQNEHLLGHESNVQLMQCKVSKYEQRNCVLKDECDHLHKQLGERCRQLEMANQKLLRRDNELAQLYSSERCGFIGNRTGDRFNVSPIDMAICSSSSLTTDNQYPLTSTGFCTDTSLDLPSEGTNCQLLCNHGCYHSRDCNNTTGEKLNPADCGFECRHSEECLQKKRRPRRNNRRRVPRRSPEHVMESVHGRLNSNNHTTKEKSPILSKTHSNPNCPYNLQENKINLLTQNTQTMTTRASGVQTDSKNDVNGDRLRSIASEYGSMNVTSSSSTSDTSQTETSPLHISIVKSDDIIAPRNILKAFSTVSDVFEDKLQPIESIISENKETKKRLSRIYVDNRIFTGKKQSQNIASSHNIPLDPLQQHASLATNDTAVSALSHVTPSIKNVAITSTLAQVPSLSDEVRDNISAEVADTANSQDNTKVMHTHVFEDEDPTNVSESLDYTYEESIVPPDAKAASSSSDNESSESYFDNTSSSAQSNLVSALIKAKDKSSIEYNGD